MHREIAADAVAGAVIEIEPGGPEIAPRQRVELRAGCAFGKNRTRDCDMPLQHAGEAVAHFGCRFADDYRARDVGGAVLILPSGIDQEEIAGHDAAVGLACDTIMHHGAIRPAAGDGGERQVLEQPTFAAEAFQRLHRVDLGQLAGRRLAVEPGEEFRQGCAVAQMRCFRTGDFR